MHRWSVAVAVLVPVELCDVVAVEVAVVTVFVGVVVTVDDLVTERVDDGEPDGVLVGVDVAVMVGVVVEQAPQRAAQSDFTSGISLSFRTCPPQPYCGTYSMAHRASSLRPLHSLS